RRRRGCSGLPPVRATRRCRNDTWKGRPFGGTTDDAATLDRHRHRGARARLDESAAAPDRVADPPRRRRTGAVHAAPARHEPETVSDLQVPDDARRLDDADRALAASNGP